MFMTSLTAILTVTLIYSTAAWKEDCKLFFKGSCNVCQNDF